MLGKLTVIGSTNTTASSPLSPLVRKHLHQLLVEVIRNQLLQLDAIKNISIVNFWVRYTAKYVKCIQMKKSNFT